MKFPFLYFLFFVSIPSFGQTVSVKTIKQVNPITKEAYIFPKVIVTNSTIATRRINDKLRERILYLSVNSNDKNLFDSVWTTKQQAATLHNLSYKVEEITPAFISISISGEGCGAYCESFTNHFTFNLQTGNQLALDSLFTNEGLKAFVRKLNNNKTGKLKNKLKQIDRSLELSKTKSNLEEKERLLEMKTMYIECIDKTIDPQYFDGTEFLIKKGMLIVYTERCSAHYNMALDELWIFKYQMPLANMKNLLSQFGSKLIPKQLRIT